MEDYLINIQVNDTWKEKHWKMTIRIDQFLDLSNMQQFKKLLKTIRNSDNPEEEKKIADYIKAKIEADKDEIEELKRYEVGYEQKVRTAKIIMDDDIAYRNTLKVRTEARKNAAEKARRSKLEYNTMRSRLTNVRYDIHVLCVDKEYMEKCLVLVS